MLSDRAITSRKLTPEEVGLSDRQAEDRSPMTPEFHLTDVGNAQRLVSRFGRGIRYCFPWKKWLVWDRRRWKVDDSGRLATLAKRVARGIHAEASRCIDDAQRKLLAAR